MVRLWPAWKCPRRPCIGSHPGAPTPLTRAHAQVRLWPAWTQAAHCRPGASTPSLTHTPGTPLARLDVLRTTIIQKHQRSLCNCVSLSPSPSLSLSLSISLSLPLFLSSSLSLFHCFSPPPFPLHLALPPSLFLSPHLSPSPLPPSGGSPHTHRGRPRRVDGQSRRPQIHERQVRLCPAWNCDDTPVSAHIQAHLPSHRIPGAPSARLEMRLALPRPLTSRHTNPLSAWPRYALWPAWKCCLRPRRPSHPGTPTPPTRSQVKIVGPPGNASVMRRAPHIQARQPLCRAPSR